MPDRITDRISVVEGDITQQRVDAIVNAANPSLSGGGGVDGAIHRAAGPELDVECRMLGGCSTGDAVMTKGYRLPARFVIHTVGPVWKDGEHGEDELLASCYRKALEHAESHGLMTIAFPAISSGAYGFPVARATRIAVRTVMEYLRNSPGHLSVIFVCHSDEACRVYRETLQELPAGDAGGQDHGGPKAQESGRKTAGTPGDIREQVAGQLQLIETVYRVRITNRDSLIETIVRNAGDRRHASLVTAAINGWVAVNGITGRVEVPLEVITRILRETAGR